MESNLLFYCSIAPKRVTSLSTHIRVIALKRNTAPFRALQQQRRAFGNTISDLTGPRFEPQTSRDGTNALLLDQLAGLVSRINLNYFIITVYVK